MRETNDASKCTRACNYCRVKKAKCSGTKPCTNCLDHNEECWHPVSQRGERKRKARDETMAEKFARLEAMVQASMQQHASPAEARAASVIRDLDIQTLRSAQNRVQLNVRDESTAPFTHGAVGTVAKVTSSSNPSLGPQLVVLSPPASSASPERYQAPVSGVPVNPFVQSTPTVPMSKAADYDTIPQLTRHVGAVEDEPGDSTFYPAGTMSVEDESTTNNVDDAEESDPEDPKSYLPIFAESAMDWMTREIGMPDFNLSTRRLAADVLQTETLDRTAPADRAPEPDFTVAMRWTRAFFERSPDALFGIILQPDFEARLRDTFERGLWRPGDHAWFALRHAVYATGCRIALSVDETPTSFTEARTQSWRYFENALTVHTELLYGKTDSTAIQALLAMAFFAEGLGSRSLEYMMVSGAIRLAHSKGLHLQVSPKSRLGEDKILHRQYLWWCLYSYDKHIAWRSGRPSAIDDDNISCPLPKSAPKGSIIQHDFFLCIVRHSQINSAILKNLHSVKAMKQTADETLRTVHSLEKKLKDWRASVPTSIGFNSLLMSKLPDGLQPSHSIFLEYAYHGSLIAIYSPVCYPWNRSWQDNRHGNIIAQRQRSAEVVAESARSILKATQRMQMSAASHVWLTVFYPLVGLVNLFIYVIQNPTSPSTNSDIALMEVIVGHFAYLGYISNGEFSTSFPREVVSIARRVVDQASSDRQLSRSSNSENINLITNSLPPLPEYFAMDDGQEEWPFFCPQYPAGWPNLQNGLTSSRDVDSLLTYL